MKRLIAGVPLLAVFMVVACSSPPGPAPANPAPELPSDAVAYDDLKSVDRPFPFAGDCSQFSQELVMQAGLAGTGDVMQDGGGPAGCKLGAASGAPFEFLAVETDESLPTSSHSRRFESVWLGGGGASFRRFLLLERYYAVETVEMTGLGPSCQIVVDTGSKAALRFSEMLLDAQQSRMLSEQLNPGRDGRNYDRDAVETFKNEHCPAVHKAARLLITAIDPDGGSLKAE